MKGIEIRLDLSIGRAAAENLDVLKYTEAWLEQEAEVLIDGEYKSFTNARTKKFTLEVLDNFVNIQLFALVDIID